MNTEEQLVAELKSLGRPTLDFGGIHRLQPSIEAMRKWDADNPEAAAKHRTLCNELELVVTLREKREAEEKAAERALRKLGQSGVGALSNEAAKHAKPTEALGAVQVWMADDSKRWLALCGVKGSGKSVAATWAVREAIRAGGTAAFRRASEVAKVSSFEAGAAEMDRLRTVGLLVLDDFGAELLTDYAKSQLYELFDKRHEARVRTIITSNLAWDGAGGMAERLGERTVDRIGQCGTVRQLEAKKSMRRKGATT